MHLEDTVRNVPLVKVLTQSSPPWVPGLHPLMGITEVILSPAELHLGLQVGLKSRHILCHRILIWENTRHIKTLSLLRTPLIAGIRGYS